MGTLSTPATKLQKWLERYKVTATEIYNRIGVNRLRGTFTATLEEVKAIDLVAPGSLAGVVGDMFVNLTWSDIAHEEYYEVQSSTGPNFNEDLVTYSSTIPANSTSYTAVGFAPNKTYWVKVEGVAWDETWHRDVNPSVIQITTLAPLAAPGLFAVTNVDDTNVDLTWAAVTGSGDTMNYVVEESTTADFTSPTTVYTGTLLTYVPTGLTPNTHYYFRVHATNSLHTYPVYSYVDVVTAQNLTAPSVPVASSIKTTGMTLTWTDADSRITGYILERSLTGGTAFTTVATVYTGALLTAGDSGLTTGTTYYYRVKATKSGFTTQVSPTLTVATS